MLLLEIIYQKYAILNFKLYKSWQRGLSKFC